MTGEYGWGNVAGGRGEGGGVGWQSGRVWVVVGVGGGGGTGGGGGGGVRGVVEFQRVGFWRLEDA